MIERYSTPEMRRIWSDRAKWDRWREVELAVMAARGVPLTTIGYVSGLCHDDPDAIAYFEGQTRHDFVGWLRAWSVGADPGPFREVHFGMTSSDVVDTALGMAIRDSSQLVELASYKLVDDLRAHSLEHLETIRVARTHGQPAEVSSWGLLVHDVARAAHRARAVFVRASTAASRCVVSGPVGTYAELGPEVEQKVAAQLGLRPAVGSTQVVERGAIADVAYGLVALATVCERFALQVRLGARDGELAEGRGLDQVGSSSMPQKRNPVTSEKIVGLARIVRGLLHPMMESVALWDERDISHSSVERIALPEMFAETEHLLLETSRLVRELVVDRSAMRSRVHAEYVGLLKHWALCRMLERGYDRWDAHEKLRDAHTLAEIEGWTMEPAPGPEWFLRRVLDKEASAMV